MLNINRFDYDTLRVFFGNFFNFHATMLRSNNCWLLAISIKNESKVELSHNVNTFVNEYCIH